MYAIHLDCDLYVRVFSELDGRNRLTGLSLPSPGPPLQPHTVKLFPEEGMYFMQVAATQCKLT